MMSGLVENKVPHLSVVKSISGFDFCLDFELDPPVKEWTKTSLGKEVVRERYKGGDYILNLEEVKKPNYTLVSFDLGREEEQGFTLRKTILSCEGSSGDLHRVWIPYYPSTERDLLLNWVGPHKVAADRGMPIIFGLNRAGGVKIAMGFIDQRLETEIYGRTPVPWCVGKGKTFLELKRPIDGIEIETSKYSDAIFVTTEGYWFDAMQRYSRAYDEKLNRSIQGGADHLFDPVWNTIDVGRYCEDVDQERVLENAKIAAKLGFKIVMIDAGWFCENGEEYGLQFLQGQRRKEAKNWCWPESCGDYEAYPKKFPDMVGLSKDLKKIGMGNILWVAPFACGEKTKKRAELKNSLIELDEVTSQLCPRNPVTQEHVPKMVARVIKDYELMGVKLDMIDSVPMEPCKARHRHNFPSFGYAMSACLSAIHEAVERVKPGTIIEFRQSYSNINNLYYANAHRAGDCPMDYDQNRRLCILLRSYVPSGVSVHVDYVWWREDESMANIAKTLSTITVCGVPTIGINLTKYPPEHLELIKRWLGFYEKHRENFRYGQLRPIGNDLKLSTTLVHRGNIAYISYGTIPALRIPLPEGMKEIYLFNCTNEDSLYTILQNVKGEFKTQTFDPMLKMTNETKVSAKKEKIILDAEVLQGGYIKLSK